MLISWVIECLTSWIPHQCTIRNFTHGAWAIWDWSNYDLFWIIPDPGRQNRITLSVEYICTIPFQPGTSDIKIPEWEQHCSNSGMPCHLRTFGTFRRIWNWPKEQPRLLLWCLPDIFAYITNRGKQWPGMLIVWKNGQVSFVGCTNEWYYRRSCRRLIICIPPPVAGVHLAVYSATLQVGEVHWFDFKVRLEW